MLGVSISTQLAQYVTLDLRKRVTATYLDSSWPVRSAEPAGRLQHLLITFTYQIAALINALAIGMSASISLLALVVISMFVDLLATALVLGSLSVLLLVLVPVRRRVGHHARTAATSGVEYAEGVAEYGSVGLELHAFGVAGAIRERLDDLDDLADREAKKRRMVDLISQAITPLYISLAYALVLLALLAASQGSHGQLQSFGAVVLIMLRALTYGQQIQASLAESRAQTPVLHQVEDAIERYASGRGTSGLSAVTDLYPIVFDGVCFEYEDGTAVLDDVTIAIGRGEIIGIVGPSGAGKTTFLQLLLGVREPTSGSITAAGIPISDLRQDEWRRAVGFVAQNPTILSTTVQDNVRFFRHEITDSDIQIAIGSAHLDKDLRMMGAGTTVNVGERGGTLSGGQRQRLAIARAIAGSPPLLVLDEPTSALDPDTETGIRATLKKLAESQLL
jgi:ABC-type multidrug transport system fused ATPase/permease subunit